MSDTKLHYSPYGYRVHVDDEPVHFPMVPPFGSYFYLITTSPEDRKRKYFYGIDRMGVDGDGYMRVKVNFAPVKGLARPFDNLRLAEAYAEFLCQQPDSPDVWITLEHAN